MHSVKISSKYQVVIPLEVREKLKLTPGTMIHVQAYDSRIELIPLQPMKKLRGSLKGMNTSFARDKKDRL